jgi:hypothetical protein
VKLKASAPVHDMFLMFTGSGMGRITSPAQVDNQINKGQWLDFKGSKVLGNPFDHFPESGTITIDEAHP